MSHFQVTAIVGDGATFLFGVQAQDETGAAAAAHERLSWSGQAAVHLEVIPVCGDPIARLRVSRDETAGSEQ